MFADWQFASAIIVVVNIGIDHPGRGENGLPSAVASDAMIGGFVRNFRGLFEEATGESICCWQ